MLCADYQRPSTPLCVSKAVPNAPRKKRFTPSNCSPSHAAGPVKANWAKFAEILPRHFNLHATDTCCRHPHVCRAGRHCNWPHRLVGAQGPGPKTAGSPRFWLCLGHFDAGHCVFSLVHPRLQAAKYCRVHADSFVRSAHPVWAGGRICGAGKGADCPAPKKNDGYLHQRLPDCRRFHAGARSLSGPVALVKLFLNATRNPLAISREPA